MNIKQLFRAGLGLALVALVSVQAVAFMNTVEQVQTSDPATDYVAMVDEIALQLDDKDVDCEAMLAKIDDLLTQIDDSLDEGAIDEESLLVARDALVGMRLELPCLQEELAGVEAAGPVNIISDVAIGESIIDTGFAGGGYAGGGGGAGCVNCAPSGGAVGGNGLRRLLLLGGLTGGIIAAATSGDDDNPPPQTSM